MKHIQPPIRALLEKDKKLYFKAIDGTLSYWHGVLFIGLAMKISSKNLSSFLELTEEDSLLFAKLEDTLHEQLIEPLTLRPLIIMDDSDLDACVHELSLWIKGALSIFQVSASSSMKDGDSFKAVLELSKLIFEGVDTKIHEADSFFEELLVYTQTVMLSLYFDLQKEGE